MQDVEAYTRADRNTVGHAGGKNQKKYGLYSKHKPVRGDL